MSKTDNNFVAMGELLCPVCSTNTTNVILMHTRFKDISEVHGKTIDFMEEPCEECQKNLDNGFVNFIEIDPEQSKQPYKPDTVYKLNSVWVKREVLSNLFGSSIITPLAYCGKGTFDELGLTDMINEHRQKEVQNAEKE